MIRHDGSKVGILTYYLLIQASRSKMAHSFEGTTLALQHYYDIVGTSRRLPLLTVYQANDQPFGHRMAVWMAAWNDSIEVSAETAQRLDEALLKNRAVTDPHALKVLDYGTSAGCSFVVTDAVDAVSLKSWMIAHGALSNWQILRLLEQLTGIITAAHKADFRGLCLTSDNIFITSEERFEIVTGPLGIGFHRSEILGLRNVSLSPGLMRHIPPWEYQEENKKNKKEQTVKSEKIEKSDESESSKGSESAKLGVDESLEWDDPVLSSQVLAEESKAVSGLLEGDESSLTGRDESIQELDISSASIVEEVREPEKIEVSAPEGLCPDMYNLSALIYEAFCGQHPYFNDERDLCDSALLIVQANPVELSRRIEIDDALNELVMGLLREPRKDAEAEFLKQFASCCSEQVREKVREADKNWIAPGPTEFTRNKKARTFGSIRHPRVIWGVGVAVLLFLAVFLTWHFAQYSEPVDLFAIPELVPTAPGGIDVVISPRTLPPDTSLYLVSLDDGSLMKLGSLPYNYRQQEAGAKLMFVIADESGHTMSVPVTVKGEQGLMIVPVDLSW